MGGEQYWPAPRGNPCSFFFSCVDLDFFCGGGDSRVYWVCSIVVRNIVNVYKKILKCSQNHPKMLFLFGHIKPNFKGPSPDFYF